MRKKWLALSLVGILSLSMFVGCGKKEDPPVTDQPGDSQEAPAPDKGGTDEVIEINFWHAMSAVRGESIEKMVADFNESQDKIKVTAVFQGEYDDAINKLKTSMQGDDGPDIMQIYDIGTRFMIDSGYIVPMQDFIDADDSYDPSDLEENLLGYYSIDDKLYSMPFNASTPLLYYNKDAFVEAGLDPEKPPTNLDEINEYAEKLVVKDGSRISQYGFSMAVYGWFFEQFVGKQNAHYVDNGNGRDANPEKVVFDSNGAGLKILEQWQKLIDSGNVGNYGRTTSDTQNAFIAGSTAMFLDSTAVISALLKGIDGRFELGAAYFPDVDAGTQGGVSIGGGSLWMIDSGNDARKDAAWEFIKYMVAPEQQSHWAQTTGYFAITNAAYDQPDMIEFLEEYPQFQVAIDQLQDSSVESRGALLGVFPEARQIVESNIEDMIQGKGTPQETLDKIAESINSAIDDYNKTN